MTKITKAPKPRLSKPQPAVLHERESQFTERGQPESLIARIANGEPVFVDSTNPPPRRQRRRQPTPVDDESLPEFTPRSTKGNNYAPIVSSPLRTDGNASYTDEGSEIGDEKEETPAAKAARIERQKNLKIQIADSRFIPSRPAPKPPRRPIPQITLQPAEDDGANDEKGSPFSDKYRKIKRKGISPTPSLQSIGREFSRYGGSESLINLNSVSSLGYSTDYSNLGGAFNTSDPERGFTPYTSPRNEPPMRYPMPGEYETDDDVHNPALLDDKKPGLRQCLGNCSGRALAKGFCILLICTGSIIAVVVATALRYTQETGSLEGPQLGGKRYGIPNSIRTSMIDPDTPNYVMTRESVLGEGKLKLVFSDEFQVDGRTFYPGDDQFWTAADLHYAATGDLEWYDPDTITTKDGTLNIVMDATPMHGLNYRSGMLQSWNKLCFKGGVMEVSASLAGPAGVTGLWPGIWTLGNLARPGYRASSDGVWPYSYDNCDVGITPNQSDPNGISYLPGQRLSKCTCNGEDHPNPGTGRGAPEIDALEGTAEYDKHVGVCTQSKQVAPFDVFYQANRDFVAIKDYDITQMNSWSGGVYQQAVSGVTMLNNSWYDGKNYQKYAFEYIPGKEDGAIAWFVGDEETFRMTGNAVGPNGNIGQRDIAREPLSMILNLGLSNNWVWVDWNQLGPHLTKGTTMRIDYVRIYQKEGEEMITCDPPGFPTTEYIKNHPKAYDNANLTTWDDTGYGWPKNQLMHGCT